MIFISLTWNMAKKRNWKLSIHKVLHHFHIPNSTFFVYNFPLSFLFVIWQSWTHFCISFCFIIISACNKKEILIQTIISNSGNKMFQQHFHINWQPLHVLLNNMKKLSKVYVMLYAYACISIFSKVSLYCEQYMNIIKITKTQQSN